MPTDRSCGPCTMCCKIMEIAELHKPVGRWCGHCKPGKGCLIYEQRPPSCRDFQCWWLADSKVPDALKPDRIRVVLDHDLQGRRVIARCDPANRLAWRAEPIYSELKKMATEWWGRDRHVIATAGRRTWVITPKEPIDLGELDPSASYGVDQRPDGTAAIIFG